MNLHSKFSPGRTIAVIGFALMLVYAQSANAGRNFAELQRWKIEHHDCGARDTVSQVESDVDAGYGADVSQSIGGLHQPAESLLYLARLRG